MSMQARVLTEAGIERAQKLLRELREHPDRPLVVPDELLSEGPWSMTLGGAPRVEHRQMTTRRDAVNCLEALSPPLGPEYIDNWGFWSWLGLFHLQDILHTPERRMRLSPEVETFVVDREDRYSRRDSYRHYLWSAWRLHLKFGSDTRYFLDRDIMDTGDVVRRITNTQRTFNSVGIGHLIVRLYTREATVKRGYRTRPGGLDHLLRILPQFELTHDVYGMSPEALLRILPPIFREWDAA